MTEPVTRAAFVPATRGLPELRITEVVLQTTRSLDRYERLRSMGILPAPAAGGHR
jgi:hypothetical protein